MNKVSPSILASDFSVLGETAARCESAGASWLHIDVMDGHFVPNISLGAPVVKCFRKSSAALFDVHLMISDPYKYAPDFAAAGADLICFHAESESDTAKTVGLIKSLGKKVGIALKPATPAEEVFPYLGDIDMVLVMTVEPGFGGQSFMPEMLPKIEKIRSEIVRRGLSADIEVDGGITDKTAPLTTRAGANVLVAGSYIFKAADMAAAVSVLENA